MFLYFSVWFIILKCSSSTTDLAANFTGHSFITFYFPNQTEADRTFELSFRTSFSYGLVFSAFDSFDMLYRLHLDNKTLMVDVNGVNNSSSSVLCNCFAPSLWNVISVVRISDILTIFIKNRSYQFKLSNKKGAVEESVLYLGGLPSTATNTYHQFHGHMTNITLCGREALVSDYQRNPPQNVSYKNIDMISSSELLPNPDPYQTVTINSSDIRFPIAYTSFTNFSFSFEFKSPENVLQLLSFQMKQHTFSLRKDYKQLLLELNLHGETVQLTVELESSTQWISVVVTVSDRVTLLSSGDRNNEVQYRSPLVNKRFNRQPIYFGASPQSNSPGFRGCIRKFVVNGEVFPLYSRALSQTSTLVGCWYPTPTCDNISCNFSCSQTWDETKCTTVRTLPKIAEFAGFGIIQIDVPTLLEEQEEKLSISLEFISRSTKADTVLISLQHQDQPASFFDIEMLQGYLMLSLSLIEGGMHHTNTPMNDGQAHVVTVNVTSSQLSFQVDATTWGKAHELDVNVFRRPTSIKIGGSSLKLNTWGFTGCLSEIAINGQDLLSRTASHSASVVIQSEVQLQDKCSLVEETEPPVSLTTSYTVNQASSTAQYTNHTVLVKNETTEPPTNLTYSVVDQPDNSESGGKSDEQLLIGLMLGFVTLLAVAIFLAYFLWQRRQMHQNAKERARKASDELALDEEFLNKTYNPKKQDKYTAFTPHALDAILEESESLDRSSIASSRASMTLMI